MHSVPSLLPRLSTAVFSPDPRLKIRIMQWMIASVVYAGAALMLLAGRFQGWMSKVEMLGWYGFVGVVMVVGYVALRTRWSERFMDPAMTLWQLSMGVIAVLWGYLICGPMRTAALLPFMVIFGFGAFSLRRRQIAFLTALALVGLLLVIGLRNALPGFAERQQQVRIESLAFDLNNMLMVAFALPVLAALAVRQSGLRRALREQKAALATALGEVNRLATYDELTGVPNRRSMGATLGDAANLANRGGPGFSVVVIDLDHFKQVNDTLGHAQGDVLLQEFATLAASGLRGTDTFGRWGGEEFLFLLSGINPEAAARVVDRLQARLRDTPLAGHTVKFSAGISAYRLHEDPDATVARADTAMYAAKHAGRDTVRIARTDGDAES